MKTYKQFVELNAGPSTPIKNYGGKMGYGQDFGAGRVGKIRLKGGKSIADVLKIK